VEAADVHVLVYASDENVKPNCLYYLQKRANRYGINLHFSKLTTTTSQCEIRKCGQGGVNSFLDYQHAGTERIDICEVLKKAMCNPPLDGFSLLDALRHEKLIRKANKPQFDKLLQLNYHGLNSFSHHETIRTDLGLYVRLLCRLELDNDFLVSQQNISNICDIDITAVSERGQQARVRNLICRFLHDKHIVVNSGKTVHNPLVVKKLQEDSDFPNPEWLENPPIEAMRSEMGPVHILKQRIPDHVKNIVNLKHNNLFAYDNAKEPELEPKPPPDPPPAPLGATHQKTFDSHVLDTWKPPEDVLPTKPLLIPKDDHCIPATTPSQSKKRPFEDDIKETEAHPPDNWIPSSSDIQPNNEKRVCVDNQDVLDQPIDVSVLQRIAESKKTSRPDNDDGTEISDEPPLKRAALSSEEEGITHESLPAAPPVPKQKGKNAKIWWKAKKAADFKRVVKKPTGRKKKATAGPRFSGGLVLDAQTGFYTKDEEAAGTFDFGSLYPSIMEGYLICYMRVIYKRKWLEDPRLKIQWVPITATECVAYAKSYDGVAVETILPAIVQTVVNLRAKTRAEQKNFPKDSFQWQTLEQRQLAAKVVQNSVYGFTGSDTSGMTCTAIAAAVTNIGRWMNRTVRFCILFLGGWIYYGDTDSVMARFWIPKHCTTRDQIFEALYEKCYIVEKFCTNLFPKPNKLNFEKVKTMFLLLGKKTYATIEMDPSPKAWLKPQDDHPHIAGITAKKRDKAEHAQRIGLEVIHKLLYETISLEDYKSWFRTELDKICKRQPTTIEELAPFTITCALSSEYKKDKDVLALSLADMITKESGARPRPGSRLPFVVAREGKRSLHCDHCETPDHFLHAKHHIDFNYYIENQIFNCLKQILSLPVHKPLLDAFAKISDSFGHKCHNKATKCSEITQFFKRSVA